MSWPSRIGKRIGKIFRADQSSKRLKAPIPRQGWLVGMATAENIGRFPMFQSAIRSAKSPPPRAT